MSLLAIPFFLAGLVQFLTVVVLVGISAGGLIQSAKFDEARRIARIASLVVAGASAVVLFAYLLEITIALVSNNEFEAFTLWNQMFGPYAWTYWIRFMGLAGLPQLFWIPRIRKSMTCLVALSILILAACVLNVVLLRVAAMSRDELLSGWTCLTPLLAT